MKLSGFVNYGSFIKEVRRRKIEVRRGGRNIRYYPRAKLEQIARDRTAAEAKRNPHPRRDPLNDPLSSGEVAARAYKMFNERVGLIDVAIALELPGPEVERLFEAWWRLGQRSQSWLEGIPAPTPANAQATAPVPAIDPAVAAAAASATTTRIERAPVVPPKVPHTPLADGSCCVEHTLAFTKKKLSTSGGGSH